MKKRENEELRYSIEPAPDACVLSPFWLEFARSLRRQRERGQWEGVTGPGRNAVG